MSTVNNTHNPLNDLQITEKVDVFDAEKKIWQIGTIIKKTRNTKNENQMLLYNFIVQIDCNENMKIKIRNFNKKRLKLLNTVTPIHSYLTDKTKQVCNCQKSNTCASCNKKFCIDCYGSVKFNSWKSNIQCHRCYEEPKLKNGNKLDVYSTYNKRWHIATITMIFESNEKMQIYVSFDDGHGYQRVNDYKPLHTHTPIHAYLKNTNNKVCSSDNSKICTFCKKKYCIECYSSNKKNNCICYQCFVDNTNKWLTQLKVNDKLDISYKYRWYIARIIKMFPGESQMKILIKFENSSTTELITIVFNDIKHNPNKIIEKLQPIHTHTSIHKYLTIECNVASCNQCSVCWKNFCGNCASIIQDKKCVCFQCIEKAEFSEKVKVVENLYRKTKKKIKIETHLIYIITKYSVGAVFLKCSSLGCDDYKIFENKFNFLNSNSKEQQKKFGTLISFFCVKCNQQKQNEQKQWIQNLKVGNKLDVYNKDRWYIATVNEMVFYKTDLKIRVNFDGCYVRKWIKFKFNEDVYKIINKVKPLHSMSPIHEYTINGNNKCKICVVANRSINKTEKCSLCLKIYCIKCITMVGSKDGIECSECVQKNEYSQKHKVVVIIIENELYGTNIQIEQNVFHIITKYAMGYVLIECGYMKCVNHFRNIERFADFIKFKPKINWFCSDLCKQYEYERSRHKHIKNLKNINEKEFTIQKERETQRNERKRKEIEFLLRQEKKRNKKRLKKLKKKEKKKRKKQAK